MGMLLVLAVLLALGFALWLFVHAVRSDRTEHSHGWIIVVPLLVIAGWIIEMLIMGA
jgi:hypothetical protein